MEPAVVEPESLPVCAQVLKWNLGAAKDVQSVLSCTEKPQSVASSTVTFFAKTLKFGVGDNYNNDRKCVSPALFSIFTLSLHVCVCARMCVCVCVCIGTIKS